MGLKVYLVIIWKGFLRHLPKTILLAILLAIVFGFVWFFAGRGAFKQGVSEGVIGTYTEKDLPLVVTTLLSKGLVGIDKTGAPTPLLAESWEVLDNAREYRFRLRDDIYWVDGSKVRAQELDISIPDVEVSAKDDQVISFKLADSFSPFPTLLSRPIFKKGTYYLGVGPYNVSDIDLSSVFLRKVTLTSSQEDLPNVMIRFYANEQAAKQAIRIGEVQSLVGVVEADDLATEEPFEKYSKINYGRLVVIFYNTEDNILSDENFRLALSYNAPVIIGEEEAKTSVAPTSWAFNPEVKNYLDNVDQGKVALGRVKNGKDSTITLVATSSLSSVGARIVEAWNQRGIKATLQVESGIPQNFQALLITQNIPSDPDQYSLWHSTQGSTNVSKVALPRVDKTLEDGRKEVGVEKRKTIYADFQKVLLDHAPATPLYFPKTEVIYLKKVKEPLMKILDLQLGGL